MITEMEKILVSMETRFSVERNPKSIVKAFFVKLFTSQNWHHQLNRNLRIVMSLGLFLVAVASVDAQSPKDIILGQSKGPASKKDLPGFEAAKIPSGLNFPSELEKVYGDSDYELGSEHDISGFFIEYTVEDTSILRIEGNKAMILKAGETKVYAEISAPEQNLNTVPLVQTLKIHPGLLELTVTPGQKKVYGSPDPEFQYQLSGFVYGEGKEVVSGQIEREKGEEVGKYELGIGDLNAGGNYQIGFSSSFFEITKREIIVEALETKKYFGTDDPKLNFKVTGLAHENVEPVVSGNPERESGEKVGKYVVGAGNLTANPNYEMVFKEAVFEILPVEISTIFDPLELQTEWSVMPDLPKNISSLTKDGQVLEIPVRWEKSMVNLMEKGTCFISGTLELPEGVQNPSSLRPSQKLNVLAKPAPEDLLLNQLKFEPSYSVPLVEVGQFAVVDQLDDFHTIALVEGSLDNSDFQVDGFSLFWKNNPNTQAKKHYSILVNVLDRVGNSLEKEFEISSEFTQISTITVHNAFTPNNDGINDTWGLRELEDIQGVEIQVFDKYGNLLFSAKTPEDQWDGTFQGKSVPADTYFWVINSQISGETRKGFLSLLRK